VRVTLQVHRGLSSWTADVTFENRDSAPLRLSRWNLFEGGEVQNDVFVITTDGKRAGYLGAHAKRSPRPEDFVPLAPGASLRHSVELDRAYAIPFASGQRHAVYDAYHGDAQIVQLRSNEVVF
jgi:hypothetical protein